MNNLRDLIEKYGSDKNRNEYTPIYHSILNPSRGKKVKLLEIGIGTLIPGVASSMVGYSGEGYKPGGSLRAFRDFLPQGEIYGGDVQPDCMFEEDRINTFLFDSTDSEACEAALGNLRFDIIIDDGLHIADAQMKTFKNLWHRLESGGYYFIEDIAEHNPLYSEWRSVFAEAACEKWTNEYKNILVFSKY